MSPPLEGSIRLNPLPGQYEEKSASIAFTELLLNHLTDSGKGVTIVSSAFVGETKPVDSPSEDAYPLRRQLIEKQLLRAVITQQNGLFFRREPVHILSMSQGQAHHTDYTWFCRIEKDGYPIERQHDFTEDADLSPEQNDIPFLQQVLQKKWKMKDIEQQENGVRIEPIRTSKPNASIGIVLQTYNGTKIVYIRKGRSSSHNLILCIQHTTLDSKGFTKN